MIREEAPHDASSVRVVLEAAFPEAIEADLVDRLRSSCPEGLSLVGVEEGRVVGHILFTPVVIETGEGSIHGLGLAPMAVLPEFQRKGIGSALVREGIERLRRTDCPFIVVLGHPEYYPRFGFVPASNYGVRCQWEGVPDEVFRILVLRDPVPAGIARYRPEFDETATAD
jgi:putative acetyltransferase